MCQCTPSIRSPWCSRCRASPKGLVCKCGLAAGHSSPCTEDPVSEAAPVMLGLWSPLGVPGGTPLRPVPSPVQAINDKRMQRSLEAVDDLKQALLTGKIKAFACVGIADDHVTFMWSGTSRHTTHLEMGGAIASLLHTANNGELTG